MCSLVVIGCVPSLQSPILADHRSSSLHDSSRFVVYTCTCMSVYAYKMIERPNISNIYIHYTNRIIRSDGVHPQIYIPAMTSRANPKCPCPAWPVPALVAAAALCARPAAWHSRQRNVDGQLGCAKPTTLASYLWVTSQHVAHLNQELFPAVQHDGRHLLESCADMLQLDVCRSSHSESDHLMGGGWQSTATPPP